MSGECENCGLAACDLPDGVDPELIFEDGLCQGCQQIPEQHRGSSWAREGVEWAMRDALTNGELP